MMYGIVIRPTVAMGLGLRIGTERFAVAFIPTHWGLTAISDYDAPDDRQERGSLVAAGPFGLMTQSSARLRGKERSPFNIFAIVALGAWHGEIRIVPGWHWRRKSKPLDGGGSFSYCGLGPVRLMSWTTRFSPTPIGWIDYWASELMRMK